jgi:hypothetical protein
MQGLERQNVERDVKRLEHELRLTHDQLEQIRQLLEIADPHGEYQKRLQGKQDKQPG